MCSTKIWAKISNGFVLFVIVHQYQRLGTYVRFAIWKLFVAFLRLSVYSLMLFVLFVCCIFVFVCLLFLLVVFVCCPCLLSLFVIKIFDFWINSYILLMICLLLNHKLMKDCCIGCYAKCLQQSRSLVIICIISWATPREYFEVPAFIFDKGQSKTKTNVPSWDAF